MLKQFGFWNNQNSWVVIDQRHFSETKAFINELIANGILQKKIEVCL
jgi:hypothetical protein